MKSKMLNSLSHPCAQTKDFYHELTIGIASSREKTLAIQGIKMAAVELLAAGLDRGIELTLSEVRK